VPVQVKIILQQKYQHFVWYDCPSALFWEASSDPEHLGGFLMNQILILNTVGFINNRAIPFICANMGL